MAEINSKTRLFELAHVREEINAKIDSLIRGDIPIYPRGSKHMISKVDLALILSLSQLLQEKWDFFDNYVFKENFSISNHYLTDFTKLIN